MGNRTTVKKSWWWFRGCRVPLLRTMDYSPPDSSVHGTFQAGILEWFAISFSRGKEELDIAKATTLQIQCWETASPKRVRRASFHFHAVQDSPNQSVVPEWWQEWLWKGGGCTAYKRARGLGKAWRWSPDWCGRWFHRATHSTCAFVTMQKL